MDACLAVGRANLRNLFCTVWNSVDCIVIAVDG